MKEPRIDNGINMETGECVQGCCDGDTSGKQSKPHCKLSGTDGNAFAIIGKVSKTLEREGQPDKAKEFRDKAFKSKSYDEVLQLCFEYVDVE